ncbi:MAG: hypothetical protein ACOVOV_00590 [Dolichospermum sp.]
MEKPSVLDQNPESERVFTEESVIGNEGPQAEIPTRGPEVEEITPIFEQIEGMTPGGAVNVLIQAAQMAQSSGALTLRDSVMVAQAISVLQPGSI